MSAKQREIQAVVIMKYDAAGDLSVHIADPNGSVVVLTVDERTPDDLVYEHLHREEPADVLAHAPRPWGSSQDDFHQQAEVKFHHATHGLQVVE